jgi:hypothetical protein
MALTTITRPIGRRYSAVAKTAAVDNNFNYARFTSTAHGLTTGDFILVQNSPVPAYNGIWYADVNTSSEYFIRPAAGVDYVSWVNDATVSVRAEDLEHMWSAVHLPIVYEVTNSLFPFNTATALSIISIDNNNGYARLRLTGDFSATPMHPLEFIRVNNATDSRLNGIWQVQSIDYLASQAYITIDLAYSGSYNQSGAQVRKYYSNYALIIRVYAGVTDTPGAVKKSVELAATLKYIPDSNNTVRFSISEILQSYVKLRNGVGDDIMPNNIDFFTEFYVSYQETYDYSFGYTLLRFEGSIASDSPTYVGKAVNSKLPFGNPYSGYLSDYLMNTQTAKFLTLFAIPTLFACEESDLPCYQDISFISIGGGGTLQKDFIKNGAVVQSLEEDIPEKGPGVYRMPLNSDGVNECLYDTMNVLLLTTEDAPVFVLNDVSDQKDFMTGKAWTAIPEEDRATIQMTLQYSDILYWDADLLSGNYTLNWTLSVPGSVNPIKFIAVALDADLNVLISHDLYTLSGSPETPTGSPSLFFPACKYIGIRAVMASGSPGAFTVHLTEYGIEGPIKTPSSEIKTIKIDCGCSNQEIKLTWVNNLGGWEYWTFKAEKDYLTEVVNTQTSEKNILPEWPQSYGSTADTLRYETMRTSRRNIVVRSQNGLTEDEAFALSYIKSSPLVQMIDAAGRRTVTVDTNSMQITTDNQKLREIEFTITETGDIPAQTA